METNTKHCPACEQDLPLDEFAFRCKAKGSRQYICRGCHSKKRQLHYEKNRGKYIARAMENKTVIRQRFFSFKSNLVCSRCGFSHPAALDFHHPNADKESNVSQLISDGCWQKAMKEAEKCEVVCANCHRIVHHELKLLCQ